MAKRESLIVNELVGQDGTAVALPRIKRTSVIRTSTGTATLLPADKLARNVLVLVTVDTTFAAGDGAAPIFSLGQTGTTTKFINALNTGTAGDKVMYDGVLTAGTALLLTSTAATGTTSTGALTVTVIAM